MMKTNFKNNKGYTLLFAVLVSSIVLSIGISILTISKKEFLLSASARDSTSAFYAADSGLECAAYFDNNGNYFSTSTTAGPFSCADFSITKQGGATGSEYDPYEFNFQIPLGSSGACSIVTIEKYYDDDDIITTRIISRGYNVGWDSVAESCDEPSSRRVERALQLTY